MIDIIVAFYIQLFDFLTHSRNVVKFPRNNFVFFLPLHSFPKRLFDSKKNKTQVNNLITITAQ